MEEFEKHKIDNPNLPFIFHNYSIRQNTASGNNWHENIELLCLTEGTATIVNNGQTFCATAGDIAIVNKNALHIIHATTNIKYYCLIIDHAFCKDNHFDVDNLHFSPLVHDEALFKLFKQFHFVYSSTTLPYRLLELRSLLLAIALQISKNHCTVSATPHEDTNILYAIKQTIEHINANSHCQLTLKGLAKNAGLNNSYLSRSFHRITGYTIMSYINQTRCDNAKRMLRDSDAKIEQIAHQCGFENVSYFYRTFASVTGMRPKEYRMKHINPNTKTADKNSS